MSAACLVGVGLCRIGCTGKGQCLVLVSRWTSRGKAGGTKAVEEAPVASQVRVGVESFCGEAVKTSGEERGGRTGLSGWHSLVKD